MNRSARKKRKQQAASREALRSDKHQNDRVTRLARLDYGAAHQRASHLLSESCQRGGWVAKEGGGERERRRNGGVGIFRGSCIFRCTRTVIFAVIVSHRFPSARFLLSFWRRKPPASQYTLELTLMLTERLLVQRSPAACLYI